MWFVLGLLCGMAAGVALCPVWGYGLPPEEQEHQEWGKPHNEWLETRNFLYYDGTEMPVVKEEPNEQ